MKRSICKPGAAKLSLKKLTIANLTLNEAQAEMIKGGDGLIYEKTDANTTLGNISVQSGYMGSLCTPPKPPQKLELGLAAAR